MRIEKLSFVASGWFMQIRSHIYIPGFSLKRVSVAERHAGQAQRHAEIYKCCVGCSRQRCVGRVSAVGGSTVSAVHRLFAQRCIGRVLAALYRLHVGSSRQRCIGRVSSSAMLAARSRAVSATRRPEPAMFGSAPCRLPYNRSR